MADVELYTLTKSSDANVYHFRDDRVEEMVEVDIDVENHTLEIDGYDIAGITSLANKMSANFSVTEETTTATANYNTGDFVTINGNFYQVTSPVASGEAFIPGTNCTKTNVGFFLTNLISSVNALNSKLPAVPSSVGKYILKADRRVGGALSYIWEKDDSGEWDYSHLTYWHGNGLYNYNKDDSGTTVPVISTSNVTRFLVCYDESYNGSPKLNYKNVWGAYIPATVSSIKITLATGSMVYPMVVKQHLFPDNSLLYERLYVPGWQSTNTFNIDVDQIRENAGGFTGDLYYFIEVAKTNYGNIAASEVVQYYPGIEYFKEET